jgi:MYXO-CTERM domain-containing protein
MMKHLSRSDSRRAVSASSLFVAAVALSAVAHAVADIGVTTSVTREATAGGLTGNYWAGDVSFGSGGTLLSATRPNGQTNWPQQYGSWQVSTPQGPPLTGAQIDSWMDSNSRGTFSCTWSVGVGATYPGTYQTSGDFAPYYVAPTARTYLQLTQSSIAQFNDICANGLTGTFTFNTTQDINQAGFVGASFFISGPTAAFSNYVSSGNTLTVTIQSALSTYSSLLLFGGTSQASFQASTNYPFPETAFYNSGSNTLYQAAPVPAPGALALLGLAGLSGGRRRRG